MAALTEVPVPDIGDFTDVPVVEILVAVGQEVAVEEPLVTLESDKASMDVPAPVAGTVKELKVAVGDKVSEGSLLAVIEAGEDGAGAGPETAAGEGAGKEAVEGAGKEAGKGAVEQASPPEPELPPEPSPSQPPPTPEPSGDEPVYASPSVRRVARERGIDLSTVTGTGRKGRITKADLDRPPASAAAGEGDGGLGLAPWPQVDFAKYGEIERVELAKIRRISAANLARNWVRIPHVTHNEEADITDLEAFRKQLNSEQSEAKVTMVALVLKACVASLKAYPEVNSSLDGDHLVLKRYFNLAFAADTPNGLVVPVIRDVDRKGIIEIASELTELSGKAREGKLGPAEMSGGTFTVSSLGGIGGTGFTPIVNAPEVAILGVTRAARRPVWDGEVFAPRLMLPLSFSYDHRVIDGALAARFCAHLADGLSDLRRALL